MAYKYVKFVTPDFSADLTILVTNYQAGTITAEDTAGIALQPDDLEHDIMVSFAAAMTQYKHLVNDKCNNNFLQFMTGEQLDIYGEAHSLPRMSGQEALTTVRFTFSESLLNTKTIFANTAVYNSAGSATYTFYTDETEVITAGQTYYDIDCHAEAIGSDYNNLSAGELDTLATAIPYVASVANTVITSGGGDIEDDLRYKIRLQLVDAVPAAGSEDQVKVLALSVSSELIDAKTIDANSGAAPGNIDVYILKRNVTDYLLHNAIDYAGVITQVYNELNQTYNRSLNTTVNVYAPTAKTFTMTVSLSVWKNRDLTNLVTDVQNVITEWRDELRNQLGAVFYDSVITNRIEKIPAIVQATVVITWDGAAPSLPKISKNYVAFLTAIPTPTIAEYIEE
jgi:uncharacterized phage protein gp47/JayE